MARPAIARSTKLNGPIPPAVNHGALWSLGGEHKENANKFFAVVSFLAAVGHLDLGPAAKGQRRPVAVHRPRADPGRDDRQPVRPGGVRRGARLPVLLLVRVPGLQRGRSCLVVGAGAAAAPGVLWQAEEDPPATTDRAPTAGRVRPTLWAQVSEPGRPAARRTCRHGGAGKGDTSHSRCWQSWQPCVCEDRKLLSQNHLDAYFKAANIGSLRPLAALPGSPYLGGFAGGGGLRSLSGSTNDPLSAGRAAWPAGPVRRGR